MLDPNHKSQIRDYLISKKLPTDILLEVQDHWENQMNQILSLENKSFQEAFIEVKVSWNHELSMVKKSFLSFGKVPAIVKSIQKQNSEKILKKSLAIAAVLTFLQLLSAKFLEREFYFMVNVSVYLLLSGLIFIMLLTYLFSKIKKDRTRAELYFYNQILNIFLWYIVLGFFGAFTPLPTNSFKVVYNFVNGINEYPNAYFVAALVSTFFKSVVTFYFLNMLRDRAKAINMLKRWQKA